MLVILSGIIVVTQPTISLFVFVSIIALQLFRLSYTVLSLSTTIEVIGLYINAPLTMFVTERGMMIDVSEWHSANALLPIDVREFGNVIVERLSQCAKARSAMVVSDSDSLMDLSP